MAQSSRSGPGLPRLGASSRKPPGSVKTGEALLRIGTVERQCSGGVRLMFFTSPSSRYAGSRTTGFGCTGYADADAPLETHRDLLQGLTAMLERRAKDVLAMCSEVRGPMPQGLWSVRMTRASLIASDRVP
jgi:hypothetical protein